MGMNSEGNTKNYTLEDRVKYQSPPPPLQTLNRISSVSICFHITKNKNVIVSSLILKETLGLDSDSDNEIQRGRDKAKEREKWRYSIINKFGAQPLYSITFLLYVIWKQIDTEDILFKV